MIFFSEPEQQQLVKQRLWDEGPTLREEDEILREEDEVIFQILFLDYFSFFKKRFIFSKFYKVEPKFQTDFFDWKESDARFFNLNKITTNFGSIRVWLFYNMDCLDFYQELVNLIYLPRQKLRKVFSVDFLSKKFIIIKCVKRHSFFIFFWAEFISGVRPEL